MNIFGKLFGSEKVVDGVFKGIDSAFFTQDEKAGHFLSLLKAYEPFKITQRFLSLVVGMPYVMVWLLAAVLIAFGDMETGKILAQWNNDTLGTPFAIILAFYFGGGMVEGIIKAKGK